MSNSFRITYAEVEENCVESQPDYVSGNPDEIQRIFDRLPRFIVDRYNMFVEYATGKFKKIYEKDEVDELIESKLADISAGESGPQGEQGPQGEKGEAGEDGVGVQSIEQTDISLEDGGENVVTVTLTDGTVSAFTVKNGSKGSDGLKGEKGDTGAQGPKGEKGDKGDTGAAGADGKDGVSPDVSVSKEGKVTRITIADSDGTHVAEIKDGDDGAGAQGDWAENDETSANYVHNRTHWLEEYGEDSSVLAKTDINFLTGSQIVNGFAENSFVEGWKYKVDWDGTGYDCQCYLVDGMLSIGNGALAGGADTKDYPFCISNTGGTACFVYKETDTAETISLQVDSVAVKTYHKLDKNFLPDDIGGGGVSSWNDLTDKPFGYEEGYIVPETTIALSDGQGMLEGVKAPLTVGEKYTVNWNGTVYECTAQSFSERVVIGDVGGATGGDSTGEPFVILDGSLYYMVMALDGAEEITVSIEGLIFTKIPENYIDLAWTPRLVQGEELLATTLIVLDSDNSWITHKIGGNDIKNLEKIIVYFDNVRYETPVHYADGVGYYIGNGAFADPTGEFGLISSTAPFLFNFSTGGYMQSLSITEQGHTVALYAESENVVPFKLPVEYQSGDDEVECYWRGNALYWSNSTDANKITLSDYKKIIRQGKKLLIYNTHYIWTSPIGRRGSNNDTIFFMTGFDETTNTPSYIKYTFPE